MPNTENRKNSNKKPTLQEHSQTVIIPQLTPEMLEQARRAAEQGKTAEQIEQEALAAAQAEQKAVESKQEAPTAEKPKTVQPANKPKTRKEAEEEIRRSRQRMKDWEAENGKKYFGLVADVFDGHITE